MKKLDMAVWAFYYEDKTGEWALDVFQDEEDFRRFLGFQLNMGELLPELSEREAVRRLLDINFDEALHRLQQLASAEHIKVRWQRVVL